LDGRELEMLVVLSLYLFMLYRFMYAIHPTVQERGLNNVRQSFIRGEW
jgi:hypothetical protein